MSSIFWRERQGGLIGDINHSPVSKEGREARKKDGIINFVKIYINLISFVKRKMPEPETYTLFGRMPNGWMVKPNLELQWSSKVQATIIYVYSLNSIMSFSYILANKGLFQFGLSLIFFLHHVITLFFANW